MPPMHSPGHNHPSCQDASFLRSCSFIHAAYFGNRRIIHPTANIAPTTPIVSIRMSSMVQVPKVVGVRWPLLTAPLRLACSEKEN